MDSSNSPTSSSSSSAASASAPLAPLRNPKYRHISKSAAKRESVQMLGSIKDLQLHFSRAGMVEHRPGAGVGVKGSNPLPSLGEDAEGEENRPPSVLGDRDRRPSERKPYKEVELPRIDPEDARREARNIVSDVRGIWGLSLPISPNSATTSGLPSSKSLYFPINFDDVDGPQGKMRSSEDIQNALVQTAQSIRRIRFLALSISHHHSTTRKVSGGGGAGSLFPLRLGGAGKLRSSLSTPSRPSSSKPLRTISNPNTTTDRKASLGALDEKEDVLGELRKAALEVLTSLRELEERLRVTRVTEDRSETPTQERPFSPYSDQGEGVFSEPEPDNYDSEEDELYNPNNLAMNSENKELMTNWEDRILSERREYKDLGDSDWEREARGARENMGKWVGIVERLFVFVDEAQGEREVESWARDNEWDGKRLEQLHAFLLSNLPLDLALRLPSTNSDNFESSLLSRLSDGYILIHAYNSSLMRSSKPWGFIPDEDVHDTLTSLSMSGQVSPSKNGTSDEGRKEKEWTFRKVGNLTCFGAALRHRYQLPISMPTTNLPVPPIPAKSSRRPRPSIVTSSSAIAAEDRIEFDPMIIAKKAQGWEEMFKGLIERWLGELVKEVRESKGHLFVDERVDRGGMI